MTRLQKISIKTNELARNIERTNNGYLFSPTTEEVYLATTHPKEFTIVYNPDDDVAFPFRIYNNR